MPAQPEFQCDSCMETVSGYTRKELEAIGWIWHRITKHAGDREQLVVVFLMCSWCEDVYEQRRLAKAKAA